MRYTIDQYLKSGSQAIHNQKLFACIGLQHVDLSSKTTCGQLEICLYSPLSTNKSDVKAINVEQIEACMCPQASKNIEKNIGNIGLVSVKPI